ncbi:MAG TPA: hypothetical protein VHL57_02020 [Flavobacteriales bacterium]|jgi:hypothetical protein|nr:hypothetical protein [Flavobacteriales bacterium]
MRASLLLLPLFLTVPGPKDYAILRANIEAQRLVFQQRFVATDSATRAGVLDSARTYLLDRIALDVLPAWYGTPWDFNGTTRTPKQGVIACGYFVNTVLQDAGLRLPRVKWSQLAAEDIVLRLTADVKRFRERPVAEVETYLRERGDGLYVVGLDNHVGFIVAHDGEVRFVHSNYYHRATGVMSEPLDGVNPLAASHYRIVGNVLTDALVRAWIQGTDLSSSGWR